MDHELFDEDMLLKATAAILKTRDGLLRAAVPNPIGTCVFLNDVTAEEMNAALHKHKEIMKSYPRQGAGLDAFVDASDTGYTLNDVPVEEAMKSSKVANGMSNGKVNGGLPNGLQEVMANGYPNGYKN